MAKIVFAMAVPHSGMLGKAAETWGEDGERDRKNTMLWYHNQHWQYDDLVIARRNDAFHPALALEEQRQRAARCAKALEALRRAYREHKPDIAVIIGKNQKEIFLDVSPSLALYTGETIPNGPPQRAVYAPDHAVTYPACPELASYLIKELQGAGFDMTELMKWPDNVWMKPTPGQVVPHAFGFIYRQIMQDAPVPNVPILMNTFYPPNQPSFRRSWQFGEALFEAISNWQTDKTVAIIASGGLSHFVCDEELDALFLDCFKRHDLQRLSQVDDRSYQAGTSEVKLYVPVLVAAAKLRWEMNLVDYVPCYRSPAGTGEGFAFMHWSGR